MEISNVKYFGHGDIKHQMSWTWRHDMHFGAAIIVSRKYQHREMVYFTVSLTEIVNRKALLNF